MYSIHYRQKRRATLGGKEALFLKLLRDMLGSFPSQRALSEIAHIIIYKRIVLKMNL